MSSIPPSADVTSHPVLPTGDDVSARDDVLDDVVASASEAGAAHESPLTYRKVFSAIPRVTAISTPNINQSIAQKWGLPPVESSAEFKKIYSSGREVLRFFTY